MNKKIQSNVNWSDWLREVGQQNRRLREFLGLSQQDLASRAGVSQGALSRLEAGRGLATPLLVFMKVGLELRARLRELDPVILNEEMQRFLELEHRVSPPVDGVGFNATPVTKDPLLEEVVRLYRQLPERQRVSYLSIMRAAAQGLATN